MIFLTRLQQHWRSRQTEWMLSFIVLFIGIDWLANPAIFSLPNYATMRIWMTPFEWGACATLVGLLRVAALYINGFWRASPHLRVLGAFLSIFFWTALFLAALQAPLRGVTAAIWLVCFVFDVLAAVYAAGDARIADDKAKAKRRSGVRASVGHP